MLGQWDEWVDMAPDGTVREGRRRFLEGDLTADIGFGYGEEVAFMMLGYPDSAVARLAETAPAFTPAVIWSPVFDPLREHPVYLEMLREMNLEGATPQRTPR